MLRCLRIEQFKCFDVLEIDFRPLTVLTGVNGSGKSSVIQPLVLLWQSFHGCEWGRALTLDGPALALGSAADVLNQESSRKSLLFSITTDIEEVTWIFKAKDLRALSVELDCVWINDESIALTDPIRYLLPLERSLESSVVDTLLRLSWISSERTGPRELLPLLEASAHCRVGASGALAAGLLHWRDSEPVRPALCVSQVPNTLFHQVQCRMHEFFPGCEFRVAPVVGAGAVTLSFRSNPHSGFQRPQNVGFGLTQLFPILVAVLAAKDGDVLIIENPEAHLHPRAQQEIGTLLATVAASGVQVIIETHSDHVLNGVRLGVRTKVLTPEQVAIHFFGLSDGTFERKSPKFDTDGKFDSWPTGFFDQFDIALSRLL